MREARIMQNQISFRQNKTIFRPPHGKKGRIQRIKERQRNLTDETGRALQAFLQEANPKEPEHVKHVTTLLDRLIRKNPYHQAVRLAQQFLRNAY